MLIKLLPWNHLQSPGAHASKYLLKGRVLKTVPSFERIHPSMGVCVKLVNLSVTCLSMYTLLIHLPKWLTHLRDLDVLLTFWFEYDTVAIVTIQLLPWSCSLDFVSYKLFLGFSAFILCSLLQHKDTLPHNWTISRFIQSFSRWNTVTLCPAFCYN